MSDLFSAPATTSAPPKKAVRERPRLHTDTPIYEAVEMLGAHLLQTIANMRNDIKGQLGPELIFETRSGNVESANDRSTPATPTTRSSRTSGTATRTTITRTTGTSGVRSAAWNYDEGVSFAELLAADIDCRRNKRTTAAAREWAADRM